MVKGEFLVGAVADKIGRDGKNVPLLRHCVDCGLVTGSFCDGRIGPCFAEDWLGSKHEDWNDNQFTPHCSACDARYKYCHFCLGKDWAMPEPHHSVKIPTSESRVDEVPRGDADTRMPMSSSDDASLPDLDQHVHVVHNFDGVLPQSLDELLASSEIPPTPIIRYSSSPTRLSRE